MSINIDVERHLTNSNAHSLKKNKKPDKSPIEGNYLSSMKKHAAINILNGEIWNAFLLRSGIK